MVQHWGQRFTGVLRPQTDLGMTRPRSSYQVDLQTQGLTSENEGIAISQLFTLEQEYPDLRILYVETNPEDQNVAIQFADVGPGQFSLAAFLTSLPSLLMFGAIIIIGYVLWSFIQPSTMNQWAIVALGAIGVGLTLYLAFWTRIPAPQTIRTGSTEKIDKEAASATSKYNQKINAAKALYRSKTTAYNQIATEHNTTLRQLQTVQTKKASEENKKKPSQDLLERLTFEEVQLQEEYNTAQSKLAEAETAKDDAEEKYATAAGIALT
jgi:hypothetical protein